MNIRIIRLAIIFLSSGAFLPAQTGASAGAGGAPVDGGVPVPAATRGPSTSFPAEGPGSPANPGPSLKENVTVAVKGTFEMDTPLDFSCTGVGPEMVKDGPVDQAPVPGIVMSFKGKISETPGGYLLNFILGLRIPIVNSTSVNRPPGSPPNPAATTTSVRNVAFQSSVNLTPGKPVTVLDANGKTIIITLTKPDDQ